MRSGSVEVDVRMEVARAPSIHRIFLGMAGTQEFAFAFIAIRIHGDVGVVLIGQSYVAAAQVR
jgi:hypothetical protein